MFIKYTYGEEPLGLSKDRDTRNTMKLYCVHINMGGLFCLTLYMRVYINNVGENDKIHIARRNLHQCRECPSARTTTHLHPNGPFLSLIPGVTLSRLYQGY